jgi:hypothetical protein
MGEDECGREKRGWKRGERKWMKWELRVVVSCALACVEGERMGAERNRNRKIQDRTAQDTATAVNIRVETNMQLHIH